MDRAQSIAGKYRHFRSASGVQSQAGMVLDVYAKLAGTKFHENFNGTDLLPALFAQASTDRPLRVFLYGGAPGRAARAAENIERRFPGVRVVGQMHGYQREGVVETINA